MLLVKFLFIDPNSVPDVITTALNAQTNWQTVSAAERAAILRRFADLMEDSAHMALLMMVAVREAGKTLLNAIAEVREAVDFFVVIMLMKQNRLICSSPVGTVVAISPWNFPLAIFLSVRLSRHW